MAEVLGIIASGIAISQIAQTTGGAVLKLKQLWNEIEDSENVLQGLIDQIDCLDPILWESEYMIQQNTFPPYIWDDTAAKNSAKHCRNALKELEDITSDLSAQINSAKRRQRKIGMVKVMLKRKQLEGIENRLAKAVRTLQVAQNGYIIAQNKLQPDIIAAKVASLLRSGPSQQEIALKNECQDGNHNHDEDNHDINKLPWHNTKIVRAKTDRRCWKPGLNFNRWALEVCRGYGADFQPPLWLAGYMYAWDLQFRKSYTGWDANLRIYSIRPARSPIFVAALVGDLNELKKQLTEDGNPHDRDDGGWTLLHYAAGSLDTEMIKFTLALGVESDTINECGM